MVNQENFFNLSKAQYLKLFLALLLVLAISFMGIIFGYFVGHQHGTVFGKAVMPLEAALRIEDANKRTDAILYVIPQLIQNAGSNKNALLLAAFVTQPVD